MSDFYECTEPIDGYALGTLSPAERERVRAHLAGCAACRRDYDEFCNVIDVLPQGLDAPAPDAASTARLLARLDAPRTEPSAATVVPLRRAASPWIGALAAGFALALLGDAWLAWQLQQKTPTPIALVTPTATPAPSTPSPSTPSPVPVASPLASATPRPAASTATPDIAGVLLRERIARLQRELADDQRVAAQREAHDELRIAALSAALASKPQTVAVVTAAPAPSASPAPAGDIVGALSNGRVFAVDGTVGSEPWHLTIVQPPGAADAQIFSDVPHAPPGDTYRTWVVRGGKTYDAGELPAGTRAHLAMPMPLQNGDVVAFSREPVGSGSLPTSPFLMQITIKS